MGTTVAIAVFEQAWIVLEGGREVGLAGKEGDTEVRGIGELVPMALGADPLRMGAARVGGFVGGGSEVGVDDDCPVGGEVAGGRLAAMVRTAAYGAIRSRRLQEAELTRVRIHGCGGDPGRDMG